MSVERVCVCAGFSFFEHLAVSERPAILLFVCQFSFCPPLFFLFLFDLVLILFLLRTLLFVFCFCLVSFSFYLFRLSLRLFSRPVFCSLRAIGNARTFFDLGAPPLGLRQKMRNTIPIELRNPDVRKLSNSAVRV